VTLLSRRTLITAGGSGIALGATGVALEGARPADAKIRDSATRRTYGPVAIIGDSASGGFLNGLNTTLEKAEIGPYRYDIKGSRRITESWLSYDSGVSAATSMLRSGFRPKAWVVALGSNDFYFFRRDLLSPRTEIEKFLDRVGNAHVAWLTIWTKRAGAYHATFNSVLHDLAARHSNFHVVDWATLAKKHPEWLQPDGAHLLMPGAKARNEYLAKAAVVACKAAGAVNGSGSRPATGSTSSEPAVGRVTLKRGSHGPAVEDLQRLLRGAGYTVRVDGDFGAATERIVKEFQRTNGLLADGIVGSVTWRALDRATSSVSSASGSTSTGSTSTGSTSTRPVLERGASGTAVKELQRLLVATGIRLRIDGDFGAATERAVTRFQRSKGLRPDGVVGPVTWRALTR